MATVSPRIVDTGGAVVVSACAKLLRFRFSVAGYLISYRESEQSVRFHPPANLGDRGTHGSAERNLSSSICPNDCREFVGTRGDGPWSSRTRSNDKAEHCLHPRG